MSARRKPAGFAALILAVVLGVSCRPASGLLPRDMSAAVVTFNIRFDNPADGPNAWPNRKDLVARTVLFLKADIVGMQEALRGQLADLEALLPGFGWVGVGRDDGREEGEFNPVFYRRDRFRPTASSSFWLSATPEIPGSRGWDAACNRLVTWARFEDLRFGGALYVFNTHFDHVGSVARRESAGLLLRRVAAIAGDGPAVVLGDFNGTESDDPYRLITAGISDAPALQDSRRLSATPPYGGGRTFNGFRDDSGPGRVIDFIFVRNTAAVLRHGIVAERWDGRFASDHYPVLAEIIVR